MKKETKITINGMTLNEFLDEHGIEHKEIQIVFGQQIQKQKNHISCKYDKVPEKKKKPTYSKRDQELDKTYVLKKFGLHSEEFEKMMRAPIVPHEVYGTEDQKYSLLIYILTRVMRISNSIKKKLIKPYD